MLTGETDLAKILASISVRRRSGTFAVVTLPEGLPAELKGKPNGSGNLLLGVEAVIREREGTTVVAAMSIARERGWIINFEAAWLSLDVHSSLDAVGLTAAVTAALSNAQIPTNVLAGYHHDHLLVPAGSADEAIQVIEALADTSA